MGRAANLKTFEMVGTARRGCNALFLMMVVLLWANSNAAYSPMKCHRVARSRSFCSSGPVCVSKDGTVEMKRTSPENLKCTEHMGPQSWRFRTQCATLASSVLSGFSVENSAFESLEEDQFLADTVVLIPKYKYMHNIFHFGRVISQVMHLAWNANKYDMQWPSHAIFFDASESVQINSWNRDITTAFSSEMTFLDVENADEKFCFRNAIFLGFTEGTIFEDGRVQDVVSAEERTYGTHMPVVPIDAIRFKNTIFEKVSKRTISMSYSENDGFAEFKLPPKTIALITRESETAKMRSLAPNGSMHLTTLLKRTAKEYGFQLRTQNFEDKSFQQQVDLMTDVGVAVSVHGANLMNTIFMQPLSSMVEIFPRFYTPTFYEAGANSGLQYSAIDADDSEVEPCDTRKVPCQMELRDRELVLSQAQWREVERKLAMAAVYLSALHELGGQTIRLPKTDRGFMLPEEVKEKILLNWKARGLVHSNYKF